MCCPLVRDAPTPHSTRAKASAPALLWIRDVLIAISSVGLRYDPVVRTYRR